MRKDFRALVAKPQHELFIGNRKTVAGVIAWQKHLQGVPVDVSAVISVGFGFGVRLTVTLAGSCCEDSLERALQGFVIGIRTDFLGGFDEPFRLLWIVRL